MMQRIKGVDIVASSFYSSRLFSGLLRGGKFGGNGAGTGGPLEALLWRWLLVPILPSLFFSPPTLGIIFFFFF